MRRRKNKPIVLLALGAFLLTSLSLPVFAQEEDFRAAEISGGTVMLDLIILRPLGVIAQIGGLALCAVALPVGGIMGNSEQVAEKLIVEPAKFTWGRPLGQLP
jgi:hypothetical protein